MPRAAPATHPLPAALVLRQRGFTVVELMVAVAMVAILAAIAMPNLREFIVNSRVSSNTNELIATFSLARAEAVRRGTSVEVEAVNGDWTQGWELRTAAGDALRSYDPLDPEYRILAAATGAGADPGLVVFAPTGALRGATGYVFSICRPSSMPAADKSRRIDIGASGAARARRDTTGSPAGACA